MRSCALQAAVIAEQEAFIKAVHSSVERWRVAELHDRATASAFAQAVEQALDPRAAIRSAADAANGLGALARLFASPTTRDDARTAFDRWAVIGSGPMAVHCLWIVPAVYEHVMARPLLLDWVGRMMARPPAPLADTEYWGLFWLTRQHGWAAMKRAAGENWRRLPAVLVSALDASDRLPLQDLGQLQRAWDGRLPYMEASTPASDSGECEDLQQVFLALLCRSKWARVGDLRQQDLPEDRRLHPPPAGEGSGPDDGTGIGR